MTADPRDTIALFGPTCLDDIRVRLQFIAASECNCDTSLHINALHDLAADDAPAMLKVLEQADVAMKQVRDLHRPFTRNYPGGDGRTVCNHCLGPVDWPCASARAVYSVEELAR